MKDTRRGHPAAGLAQAYEDLRGVMVGQAPRPGAGLLPGLGVLLAQGMAAWIEVASSAACEGPASGAVVRVTQLPVRLPSGMAGELVNVLTSMTLAALCEVAWALAKKIPGFLSKKRPPQGVALRA